MSILLYDSLSQERREFVPIEEGKVGIYVCGVTVYDDCHLGHARAYVAFDLWRRLFQHHGYQVRFVQNFTDIDDKIIDRANERGISIEDLTKETMASFYRDMDALNIQRADAYPCATQHISHMQQMIQTLIDNGSAYEVDGTVFFAVESKDDYGKLSHKVIEDLQAGARVDPNPNKKNPLDFVLWKPSKEGEPSWQSPWGAGRPGWHIECSAMAVDQLGPTIDIHAGGSDLLFPHHENEIAQSECATGKTFANYWLHNGFVTIKNEKMSKSLKNFFTIKEVLEQFPAPVLRFFLMRVHYRAPLNFSSEVLEDAQQGFNRLQETVRNVPPQQNEVSDEQAEQFKALVDAVWATLSDDLNISDALAQIFELSKAINREGCGSEYLVSICSELGLDIMPSDEDEAPADVLDLVQRRAEAKTNRDFEAADRLRDEILAKGYVVKDTPDGPVLTPA